MNDHDSEKVAGVLLRRGYRQVDSPEEARLVFYNTCSIREKAAQKVFSRLGLFNPKNGLLGSDRQNHRRAGLRRAAGRERDLRARAVGESGLRLGELSASSPRCWRELESGERRVTGLETDTDETFETEMTRRDHPFRAYLTIIEGCDKACSYCVVPLTRGPERSRASASVLAGSARTGRRGLHRDPAAGPDRQFLSRSLAAAHEFRGTAAGRGGSARAFAACAS